MKLRRCHYSQWEHFRCFHYDPETFNISAQCYWVEDDNGKRIGFVASLPMPSGTLTNAWRAHKTVVRLPADHPLQKELWAKVADAQAEMHLREGHRFYSQPRLLSTRSTERIRHQAGYPHARMNVASGHAASVAMNTALLGQRVGK